MTFHLLPSRFITCLLLAFMTFVSGGELQAKSVQAICSRVYLHNGDTVTADGDTRISIPSKRKKLEIIDNAYTKVSKVASRIDPATVDSAVVWTPTSPDHLHTLVYLKEYGWCWQLEHTPHIALYCYCPKGYYISGNGGIWIRGKGVMLVVKDGKIHKFGKTKDKINAAGRRRIEALVADDPSLVEHFRKTGGRYDRVLRALHDYNPDK